MMKICGRKEEFSICDLLSFLLWHPDPSSDPPKPEVLSVKFDDKAKNVYVLVLFQDLRVCEMLTNMVELVKCVWTF